MKPFDFLFRFAIAIIFIIYGLAKLFGIQKFAVGTPGELANIPMHQLFWYFFGYSKIFIYVLGLLELASAAFILFTKTKRVGVLFCLLLSMGICSLSFIYNIGPVKYITLGMTGLCIVLIISEFDKYKNAILVLTKT